MKVTSVSELLLGILVISRGGDSPIVEAIVLVGTSVELTGMEPEISDCNEIGLLVSWVQVSSSVDKEIEDGKARDTIVGASVCIGDDDMVTVLVERAKVSAIDATDNTSVCIAIGVCDVVESVSTSKSKEEDKDVLIRAATVENEASGKLLSVFWVASCSRRICRVGVDSVTPVREDEGSVTLSELDVT